MNERLSAQLLTGAGEEWSWAVCHIYHWALDVQHSISVFMPHTPSLQMFQWHLFFPNPVSLFNGHKPMCSNPWNLAQVLLSLFLRADITYQSCIQATRRQETRLHWGLLAAQWPSAFNTGQSCPRTWWWLCLGEMGTPSQSMRTQTELYICNAKGSETGEKATEKSLVKIKRWRTLHCHQTGQEVDLPTAGVVQTWTCTQTNMCGQKEKADWAEEKTAPKSRCVNPQTVDSSRCTKVVWLLLWLLACL